MQHPGDEEYQEECSPRTELPGQRLEDVVMHQVAEPSIPTPAPESAERSGRCRGLHDGKRIDAEDAPQKGKEVENPEVEQEHDANHSKPSRDEWVCGLREGHA